MSLEKILFNNRVSFVITNDNLFATKGVLLDSGRSNILYLVKDDFQLLFLTKMLNFKESKVLYDKFDIDNLSKYNLTTYSNMKKKLLNTSAMDVDQIFIPINDTKDVDLFLIIKLLKSIKNISVCYILRNDSVEVSYNFEIKKENTFIMKNKINVDIKYHNVGIDQRKDKRNINDMIIEDIGKVVKGNVLVVLNSSKEIQHMYYHMTKILDKRKFFITTIYVSDNKNLIFNDHHHHDKKNMVYIISSELTMRVHFFDIKHIFDSFYYNNGGDNVFNNSKDRANKYINYFSHEFNILEEIDNENKKLLPEEEHKCYLKRYVSKEFFENTYAYDVPNINPNLLYYNFLLLKKNKYEPGTFYKNFIDNSTIVNITNTLDNLKLGEMDFELIFSFDLDLRPSLLINKAIEKKIIIFPIIVAAVIINHASNMFFREKKSYSGMLKSYLDVWIMYSEEIKTLSADKDKIFEWAENKYLNKHVFYNIVSSVKKICENLANKDYIVELGLFDTNKLIQIVMPLLLEVYSGYVFEETEKHIHHYSNFNSKKSVKIINNEIKYPEKIISFKMNNRKHKEELNTVIFYLGFNSK